MPQTFYIESDEEVISVIGRLRKSSTVDVIFVFPKRALVLQSIINLRLLAREAEKLGKKIVVVSQDEIGRMLAEKAGMKTENYSEDFLEKTPHLELVSEKTSDSPPRLFPTPVVLTEDIIPNSSAIGSNDFYSNQNNSEGEKNVSLSVDPSKMSIPLRVRDKSPEKLTSLNSKRLDQITPSAQVNSVKPRVLNTSNFSPYSPTLPSQPFFEKPKYQPKQERNERLKNFYNGTTSSTSSENQEDKSKQPHLVTVSKNAHTFFFILGGISLFSLAAVVIFFFLPKAEIRVTPYKIVQTIDREFNNKLDESSSNEDFLSVRIIEKEKEVSLTVTTTGKSDGVNQKARGTVVISNNYSTESQPLVATTRLESAQGKLFRLVSGVVVPAMTNIDGRKEPGVIEAQVIADETGSEYNIDATTFTIPGFKGGSKYDKFTVKSNKAMIGGGNDGISDVTIVAKVDLDSALREAKEKVTEEFLNEIRGEITQEEKILDEQIDIVQLVAPELPSIGTVATTFDYKGTFKLRAFVFPEKIIKEKMENMNEKNMQGILFRPISSSITYSDSSADFSSGIVRIKAHALVTMESEIDKEKLRGMLLGKNVSGIEQTLQSFPEIKSIQVIFFPQWFVQSIPNSLSRVSVVELPGEDGL